MSAPGIGWVLAYTIASEIGEIEPLLIAQEARRLHRPLPAGLPIGRLDRRGPLAKNGPEYLRWALIEAATHAAAIPAYAEHYRATRRRLGRQRGAKVARVEIARRLAEAIWYMLTRNATVCSGRPPVASGRLDDPLLSWATGAAPIRPDPPDDEEAIER